MAELLPKCISTIHNIGINEVYVTRDKHRQYVKLKTNFPKPSVYISNESLELEFTLDLDIDVIKYITKQMNIKYELIKFVKHNQFWEE